MKDGKKFTWCDQLLGNGCGGVISTQIEKWHVNRSNYLMGDF